ncbi:DUF2195 family protein [Brucella intermedia]|uniref:DUF2195 family protein n=1 Tax=Brucella intermedia TaxID=94625 RepID=UPI002248CD95|nr:DUF2195 family protein [Brucella intermedia]MBM7327602.1 DUF2195 family protein [Agrobacterium sp. S2]
MFRLIYGVVLTATFCGVAGAEDLRGVDFENNLGRCVTVTGKNAVVKANAITVYTRFQLHKPIGDCGCLSARATYTSSIDIDGEQEVIQQGVLLIDKDAMKTLILASEARLVGDRKIKVHLACARPT